MICFGDGLNKNLVMNHLIWLLINGSHTLIFMLNYGWILGGDQIFRDLTLQIINPHEKKMKKIADTNYY